MTVAIDKEVDQSVRNKDAAANIAATYQITSISSNSKTIDGKRCLTFSYIREKMKAKRWWDRLLYGLVYNIPHL